jgi:hypothetical protein
MTRGLRHAIVLPIASPVCRAILARGPISEQAHTHDPRGEPGQAGRSCCLLTLYEVSVERLAGTVMASLPSIRGAEHALAIRPAWGGRRPCSTSASTLTHVSTALGL